jgi:hypothetical protein
MIQNIAVKGQIEFCEMEICEYTLATYKISVKCPN